MKKKKSTTSGLVTAALRLCEEMVHLAVGDGYYIADSVVNSETHQLRHSETASMVEVRFRVRPGGKYSGDPAEKEKYVARFQLVKLATNRSWGVPCGQNFPLGNGVIVRSFMREYTKGLVMHPFKNIGG